MFKDCNTLLLPFIEEWRRFLKKEDPTNQHLSLSIMLWLTKFFAPDMKASVVDFVNLMAGSSWSDSALLIWIRTHLDTENLVKLHEYALSVLKKLWFTKISKHADYFEVETKQKIKTAFSQHKPAVIERSLVKVI